MSASAIAGMAGQFGAAIMNYESQQQNRKYNSMLAQQQNAWNIAQWQRENEYNRPINQLKRLEEAGINPDLIYGGGVQNLSAPSPQMTAGAPSQALDWSSLANINPVRDYLDAQLKQAQINKLNSETEGQEITNDILTSDAKFRDAINQGQLDTTYSTIHLQGVQASTTAKLSEQEIKESQARIMQIDANVGKIDAEIQAIYNSIKNDNARLNLERSFNKANIEKLASECNLNYVQANSISSQLEKILRDWDDKHLLNEQQFIYIQNQDVKNYYEIENLKAQKIGIDIQNGRAKFDAYLNGPDLFNAEEYGFWNSSFQFTYRLMKSVLAK